jgi:hypothetical protein
MRTLGWQAAAMAILTGFAWIPQSLTAGSPESSLTITRQGHVHVDGTEQNLQITVWIYNRVHMPTGRLAQAEQVSTQILGQAGLQTVWLDCTVTNGTDEPPSACYRTFGPSDLVVNFVDEIRSLSPNMKEETLGFALVPGSGEPGYYAYISIQRARYTARECQTSMEMILGLAAAHEIGHLLMGSGEHSPAGVMRADWDAKDLLHAEKGDLRFTDKQVRQIKAGAAARIAQQAVSRPEAAVSR